MHELVPQDREVLKATAAWIAGRLSDQPAESEQLRPGASPSLPDLDREGLGPEAAWEILRDVLASAFPTDHPRYLAFVGGAPTPVAVLADAALSAAAVYGGSELEAGAVVAAERAAARWLCDVVGYPEEAHGTFVSGGSMANLSALVAARHQRFARSGGAPGVIVAGASAHASVLSAATIMGCRIVVAGTPEAALNGADVEAALEGLDPTDVVAVVASAGATNTGEVDLLDEIAETCARHRTWLHVDAAYGGAAMLAPTHRALFGGIERADSITLDPHKWLFTPFDCAAVLYRDPGRAREAHRQQAPYLDPVNDHEADNPSDYAVHLTRRARGIPLWTSLLAYGTSAYVDAVEHCLDTATYAAKRIESSSALELVAEPRLSVVLFRRTGWSAERYAHWSHRARLDGLGLVTPTTFAGQTVLRFCFVNPRTTTADVDLLVASLEESSP